ncbi:MAG TPA: deaminase [Burkholderiaceae bacterium]|nr:deaminase [Burkholderiaceae bacterium]
MTNGRCVSRRTAIAAAAAMLAGAARAHDEAARWYVAAEAMKRLALSWGDQPYGAVLVRDGRVIGEGPSRVVRNADPDAHAEREAIRDARTRLGVQRLEGAVLYSTSRPCSLCEAAAAQAGVSRMVYGAALTDGGPPLLR